MASRCRKSGVLRRFALPALCVSTLSVFAAQTLAQDALPEIEVNPTTNCKSNKTKKRTAAPAPRGVPASDQNQVVQRPQAGASAGQNKGFQGTPDWVYQTPGGVSVLSRELIEQRTPRNTSDLFQDMSGVFTPTDRQNPGMTVNIRGLQEQGRVNVMIDGARQNFQQAGHDAVNFVYADPELIGGVVVQKGPTSTVGGAGVIGGVVSMRTLEAGDILLPGKQYGVRSRVATGSNQYTLTTSSGGRPAKRECRSRCGRVAQGNRSLQARPEWHA